MPTETVFTWGAPPIVFGTGALDDTGPAVADLGLRRVAVVTDPGVAATGVVERVVASLTSVGVDVATYRDVRIEPTDTSMEAAAGWARDAAVDGFVAVGGGSAIDTAKAMSLLSTNDGTIHDYLNPPIGRGLAPSRPVAPLVAIPTTAGTGSESTPVCVMDVVALRLKAGISHPALRPRLAILDPSTTLTLGPEVTAASGMDVLSHALESFTARPFHTRDRGTPGRRAAYNGSNPISDGWALRALELLGRWFRRAVDAPSDAEARTGMMLAATYAGIGFGNAGVHLPHACAYPIAGMVRDYRPAGYPGDEPMVPHGQSVIATAPAAFRFTFESDPQRHLDAAALLSGPHAPGTSGSPRADREALPDAIIDLSRAVGIPNGIGAFGYGPADIGDLVEGALRQERLLAISPRTVTARDLADLYEASIANW